MAKATRSTKRGAVEAPVAVSLPVPDGALTWKLQTETPEGKKETCSYYFEATDGQPGQRVERFPVTEGQPSTALIAQRWGRGVYYVLWFGHKGRSLGPSGRIALDDPALPVLGKYPNDPAKRAPANGGAVVPPAAAAVVPPPPGFMSMEALQFAFGLANAQWAPVVARVQESAAVEIKRLELASAERIAQTQQFWQNELARATTARAPDPEVARLREKIEELEDELDEKPDPAPSGPAPVLAYIQQGAEMMQNPGIQRLLVGVADVIQKHLGSGAAK